MAKKRRSLSFLERSPRIIGLIGLTFLITGTLFALILQGGFLTPRYEVRAQFTDAAGIRPEDRVTVAGLVAGRVESLQIADGAVEMTLAVDKDVTLPADSTAEIVIETFLGRRSVALIPGESPVDLEDGAIIPTERTITPIDIVELNDISVDLLEASDADAFNRFLADLGEITRGREGDIQRLIVGLEQVTGAVSSRRRELGGLIHSLRTLSIVFGERDRTFVSLIDNLNVVLANLSDRQADLERLLVATDSSSHETADLIRENRGVLDQALSSLAVDLEVLNRHQLDLAATIPYLEQAVEGYSSVGYSSGVPNRWANIFVQSLGPAGVDSLVGECGLVDQLFDDFFGTDCGDKEGSGLPIPVSMRPAGTDPETDSALPLIEAALPCTIGDVVDTVLEGTALVPVGSERCAP